MAKDTNSKQDVIKVALEQFADSEEGSEENRESYHEDTKFARMAEQWPDAIKKQRVQEARPVLTINKLPTFIRSVVNESRQNKPSIKISPVDNMADEDTAEVISGLVRSIERNSNAEIAYDTAIDNSVTGGFGFFRISIDYSHDESFELEARIDRIPNALMVHWDPSSVEFDSSDWEYAFISDMMKKSEYEKKYPDASLVPFDSSTRDISTQLWIEDNRIRVSEYFLRESGTRELIEFSIYEEQSGQDTIKVVREKDLPMMARQFFQSGGMDVENAKDDDVSRAFIQAVGAQERNRRTVTYNKVIRRIINGSEVLEEEEWPGSTIPICPVWGDEVYLGGKRHLRSMIRDAKDPQVMFNFWRSATTELVALAPKNPWIGPVGFIPKGQEQKWASANTRSHQTLEYDPAYGRPERQSFAQVPTGALQEALSASDDMKSIMGIFDSSIGAESNERSGRAILARERQGDVANFHFIDNLSRAIRGAGRILVEIIPAVYSARESIRILGEDSAGKVIKLTQQGDGDISNNEQGEERLYNLTVGKYDVDVKTGPSFSTQREETRETLIEIMRQVPDAAAYLGDVLLDHMDFVGADKVSRRLKSLLPEAVRSAEDESKDGADPEVSGLRQQLQAQSQEFAQIKEQAMGEIKRLTDENEQIKADKTSDQAKVQLDAELKSRELAMKEREAQEKDPAVDRAFQADQNRRDRQVDLAKAIISKVQPGDSEIIQEAAASKAMEQAGAIMDDRNI
jgi:hypothetical protein